MKLYPHQKIQNKAVIKSLKYNNHVIYGAPTGFGKSIAMEDLIRGYIDIEAGFRVLVLAPSIVLINQLYSDLAHYNPKVIRSNDTRGHSVVNPNLQLTSLQTANSKLKQDPNYFGNIDYIMWDEIQVSGNFVEGKIKPQVKLLYNRYWNTSKWIGFSATPMTNKRIFTNVDGELKIVHEKLNGWDDIVYKYNTLSLISKGFLCQFKYFGTGVNEQLLSEKAKVTDSYGGYNMGEAEKELTLPSSISDFVKYYEAYEGSLNKTLVFCATIKHALLLQAEIDGSRVIHSNMTESMRQDVLDWYAKCEHATLFNVSILTTGFDEPSVNLLFLARPIRSSVLAIQCFGRSLRLYGNKVATIVDLCGVSDDCGFPTTNRSYNYIPKPPSDAPKKICDMCEFIGVVGNWTYRRDIIDDKVEITSICPNCKDLAITNRDIAKVELYKIHDSKAVIKRAKQYKTAKKQIINLIINYSSYKTSYSYYLMKDSKLNDLREILKNFKGKEALDKIIELATRRGALVSFIK